MSMLWCLAPTSAETHAIIVESDPKNGATVVAPKRVALRFNSRLEKRLCSVVLVGPQRQSTLLLRQDESAPVHTLVYDVPELPPGRYQLRWKVLATDDHVTEGIVRFQVMAEAFPK